MNKLVSRNSIQRFKFRKFSPGGNINYDELGDIAFGTTPILQPSRLNQLLQQQQSSGLRQRRKNSISFYGTKAGGRVNNNLLNNIDEGLKGLLIATGFNPEAFGNIYDFQLELNNYFAKDGDYNQIKVDGLWGDLTTKAFNLAISKAKSQMPETIQTYQALYGNPYTEIIKPQPLFNSNIVVSEINVPRRLSNSYNREQIRNLISSEGFNPYNYTGALRKALRKFLNGESNDTSLLDGTDLARFTLKYRLP